MTFTKQQIREWRRPLVSNEDEKKTDKFTFMIQHVADSVDFATKQPIIELYGVTDQGQTLTAVAKNFFPYIYVYVEGILDPTNKAEMNLFGYNLNELIQQELQKESKAKWNSNRTFPDAIRGFSFTKKKQNMFSFLSGPGMHLRIELSQQIMVGACIRILAHKGVPMANNKRLFFKHVFEGDIKLARKYTVDKNLLPGGWAEISKSDCSIVRAPECLENDPLQNGDEYEEEEEEEEEDNKKRKWKDRKPDISRTQWEVHFDANKIVSHAPDGEWSRIAPIRVLSFDIECKGEDNKFPDPQLNQVIQISNIVTELGGDVPKQIARNVFTLDTCAPLPDAEIISFDTEQDLLIHWSQFVRITDVDMIIGYNIDGFDTPYIVDRAKTLKIEDKVNHFSRKLDVAVFYQVQKFESSAFGKNEDKFIRCPGRIVFDIYKYMRREHKLRSYTLNSVSETFLGVLKDDVHHSEIPKLQDGSDIDRARLAKYCLKDSDLVQRLFETQQMYYSVLEMARTTGVLIHELWERGSKNKNICLFLRFWRMRNDPYLWPTDVSKYASTLEPPDLDELELDRPAYQDEDDEIEERPKVFVQRTLFNKRLTKEELKASKGKRAKKDDEKSFEGATVLEPKKGFYEVPIVTQDFASLYPSIMIAHNLCYSTMIPPSELHKWTPDQYTKTPNTVNPGYFLKPHIRKGFLPMILEYLLASRKKAKAEMAKYPEDSVQYGIYNKRQLSFKITANSVYGFTGAPGITQCYEISGGVTSFGRDMILKVKTHIEEKYTKANGYIADARVVYGDTDSVMVNFGPISMEEAFRIGPEAAASASALFPAPIKLEFEKVFKRFLLLEKKKYSAVKVEKLGGREVIDTKGLETVRRDSVRLVAETMQEVLRLLFQATKPAVVAFVKEVMQKLSRGEIDTYKLVESKALNRGDKLQDYATAAAHVMVAERMRERDPATAPKPGERVKFIMIKWIKGTQRYMCAEDPRYALEHNMPIDLDHYKEHLVNALTRVLEVVFEPAELHNMFAGEHTRHINHVVYGKGFDGSIKQFTQTLPTCVSCKAEIKHRAIEYEESKDEKPLPLLCNSCHHKLPIVYQSLMQRHRKYQEEFHQTQTNCQHCIGTMLGPIICSNDDCPLYYRRIHCGQDLKYSEDIILRF